MEVVLVTGAGGQLGRELQRRAPQWARVVPLDRAGLDVTDAKAARERMEGARPSVVINAAAYNAVDRAESEREAAFLVNEDGARNVATAAASVGARLTHISTDYVFGGGHTAPIPPDAAPAPLSVYGASKLAGEEAVAEATAGAAVVIRTAWLYSTFGENFLTTILSLAKTRPGLDVLADQVGSPTWAAWLADVIWETVRHPELRGVYHWTDVGGTSRHGFASAIVEEAVRAGVLERAVPVEALSSAQQPRAAARPAYSVLDSGKLAAAIGVAPVEWRTNLRAMIESGVGTR
jgi:dTDP-4-dehydrorhamnose reductase